MKPDLPLPRTLCALPRSSTCRGGPHTCHLSMLKHALFPSMPAIAKHYGWGPGRTICPLCSGRQVPDLPELLAGLRPALDHGRVAILVLEGVIRVWLCGRCRLPPLGGLRMKGSQAQSRVLLRFTAPYVLKSASTAQVDSIVGSFRQYLAPAGDIVSVIVSSTLVDLPVLPSSLSGPCLVPSSRLLPPPSTSNLGAMGFAEAAL